MIDTECNGLAINAPTNCGAKSRAR